MNVDLVKQAWEALERCWEEFDELLKVGPNHKYILGEEVARQVYPTSVLFILELTSLSGLRMAGKSSCSRPRM